MKIQQSNLDVWEIRGLGTIVRILVDRLNQSTPYTTQTVSVLKSYVTTLDNILKQVELRQGADCDPLSDVERLDKWFCTGFENLVKFLEVRTAEGQPEMSDKFKAELYASLQRAFTCVPIHPIHPTTEDTSNESSSA